MPEIKLLDSATINQIAAGEVVERPASVVKELMENAIDAGATAVTVEIRDGGIRLIRVTDNGCGIEKSQVSTAFLRHATSKIRTAMDLVTVSSLGFRGEALPSIAAVADVEMITKPKDALLGTSYHIADGEELGQSEIGAPDGTTILVKELFGHVPARRNFLKTPATEASHISALMENMTLSRPDLSFRYIVNGQNKIYSPGNGKVKDLIHQIYGRDVANNLLPIEAQGRYFSVTGFLGKPIVTRGNRSFENYFINGRYVKCTMIYKAIENAYKSFMMQHRYPFTVLYLNIDPEYIDVNVHPAKLELRFRDEEEMAQELSRLIEETLLGKQLIQEVSLTEAPKKEAIPDTAEPFETARRENEKQPAAPAMVSAKQEEPAQTVLPQAGLHRRIETEAGPSVADVNQLWRDARPTEKTLNNVTLPWEQEKQEKTAKPAASSPQITPETASFTQPPEENSLKKQESAASSIPVVASTAPVLEPPLPADFEQQDLLEQNWIPPLLSKEARRDHRLLGQIFDTYWLLEYRDKLFIMDQHAAHEKILYEKLKASYEKKERLSQMLSPSIIVTLSPLEENTLQRFQTELTDMGYEIESMGGREYALSAVPADFYGLQEKELFMDILQSFSETQDGDDSRMLDHRIATMACKAAVKGGMKITAAEADGIVTGLLDLKNPYACPHGRPTLISFSRYELEKKFKRIV